MDTSACTGLQAHFNGDVTTKEKEEEEEEEEKKKKGGNLI